MEVKDESRFPEKWAYFGFDATQPSSSAIKPAKNECWNCHDQNAAVEHSFVQFYPELLKVAKEKGTIKPSVHLETPQRFASSLCKKLPTSPGKSWLSTAATSCRKENLLRLRFALAGISALSQTHNSFANGAILMHR